MKKRLELTGIYGILDEEFSCGRSNLEVASAMLAEGVRIIQYREKSKPARYNLNSRIIISRAIASIYGTSFKPA